MSFKCLPVEFGYDIQINPLFILKVKESTHIITDLGNGQVRFIRRIDNVQDIVSTACTDFVDTNGAIISQTVAGLRTYLFARNSNIVAGEGISVDGTIPSNTIVKVIAGGPDTIGGFKVGAGLTVDGEGKLAASATSEITKVVSTEAAMLALVADPLRSYRVIRLDTQRLYYLNPGEDAAVLSNWFVGPSISAAVVSFKGRPGAVEPAFADYNADLVPLVDKSTTSNFTLEVDQGVLYLVDSDSNRKVVASNVDITDALTVRVNGIDDFINNQVDGLNLRVVNMKVRVDQLDQAVNNAAQGLTRRVTDLEAKSGVVVDVGVKTFKGRTGDVLPVAGDYTSLMIEQSAAAMFVSQTEKTYWTGKADTSYVDQLTRIERDAVASTYVKLTDSGRVGGYAPIGTDGKVPASYLPNVVSGRKVSVADAAERRLLSQYGDLTIAYQADTGVAYALNANTNPAIESNWTSLGSSQAQGVTAFNGRFGNVILQEGDVSADIVTQTATRTFVNPAERTLWNAKIDATYVDGKLLTTAQIASINTITPVTARVAALETAAKVNTFNGRSGTVTLQAGDVPAALVTESSTRTFVTPTERSLWNLKLDANQRGVANGVAPLGPDQKVPTANLPTVTPRVWRTITGAARTFATWRTNTSGNEMELFLRSTYASTANRYFLVQMRKSATESTTFSFWSDETANTSQARVNATFTVPIGWQYNITASGSTTTTTTDLWHELS